MIATSDSSVVNRKKEKADDKEVPTSDPEEGVPAVTFPANPSNISRIIRRLKNITLYEVNISLFVLVLILFTLLIIAPAHIKKKRNQVLKQQYEDITKTLNEQKASLTKKYEYLQNAITNDSDQLISDLYELVGMVSKDHHENEVKEKDSMIKTLEAESKTSINQKQLEIDNLKAEIEKHKKELEAVKGVLDTTDVKAENFCDDCRMPTMGIKCKARLDYLMGHYKTPEQEARNVIVKQDSACLK